MLYQTFEKIRKEEEGDSAIEVDQNGTARLRFNVGNVLDLSLSLTFFCTKPVVAAGSDGGSDRRILIRPGVFKQMLRSVVENT